MVSPPPLKKKPPARKGRAANDEQDVVDAGAVASPALAAPPDDDDAAKGEWLFKQNDMVLGPVPAMVLIDRIKQGELSADTPIARDGQPFKPMKLVPLFRDAYDAIQQKKRHEQEEREHNAKVRTARMVRIFVLGTLFLAPAGAGAVAGHQVRKIQPWDKTAEWIAKVPPLVDLPPRPIEVKKDEPRTDTVARADDAAANSDEPDDPKDPAKGTRKKARGSTTSAADAKDAKGTEPEEPKQTGPLPESLTNEQAVAPLKNAKDALKACFKAELESNPDVPSPVVLSYTVTEDGKAANVNLDNRELRGRPVVECVRKAMTSLRWPRFSGERKNVSVPFKLSKPPKPGESPR